MALDFTHDPARRAWVASAQAAGSDFPIQNLPFGVFRRRGSNEPWRGGVAIGDQIVCLGAAQAAGAFEGVAARAAQAAAAPVLNGLLAQGPAAWRALRHALSQGLCDGVAAPQAAALRGALVPQAEAEMALPLAVGDYTDFYTSLDHALNIGRLRDPANPLTPNFQWLPVAYHGRVSTMGVSGQRFRRPWGQVMAPGAKAPVLQPCGMLDYELELGIVVGQGNAAGEPVALDAALDHVFGITLLNDWSARDIQFWEMLPLGPFHAKNFATTLSPWIVTMDALAPYRMAWTRPADHPQPLPYLESAGNRAAGALDIQLEVWLEPEASGSAPSASRLSRTSFRHQYWTIAQMVTHHTVGGCALQPGDVLGSGTISGPGAGEAGALIELSKFGREPVRLEAGGERGFLLDGDTVVLRGWCEAPGRARIGFGEARGTVLPARAA
ncbi:MAG: fumarylacetoacetase [Rubrivivax sp.]|nr:fumarylacetoacetase [Rubrivivax sp.]